MQPALGDTVLTPDELRSYMQERVDAINTYLDDQYPSLRFGVRVSLSARRNLYEHLIEVIDRDYIYEPPRLGDPTDAGKPSLWLRVQRWGRSF